MIPEILETYTKEDYKLTKVDELAITVGEKNNKQKTNENKLNILGGVRSYVLGSITGGCSGLEAKNPASAISLARRINVGFNKNQFRI